MNSELAATTPTPIFLANPSVRVMNPEMAFDTALRAPLAAAAVAEPELLEGERGDCADLSFNRWVSPNT